ncbi:MAG: hypothetical protein IJD59_04100, partial [Clostridia bacterium]|nr:hypothetical protein [Clostridia bacterium]
FSKALFARGLLPPRKLGTFLPEEGFLASHLLAKLTKLNFLTDFFDSLGSVKRASRIFLYHRKLRKFDLAVLYCLNIG